MTAEDHLFLSIACVVLTKSAELAPVLAQSGWQHIVPPAILACPLPDINHPKSFLGQRLSWISKPVARAFGYRGFTHSLLAVFDALTLLYLKVPDSWIVPADALQDLVLGYLSHIPVNILTPAGVPLLWPYRWRFRLPILASRKGNQPERALCMAPSIYAVWMPQMLADSGIICWSSRVINPLQVTLSCFISHQSGRQTTGEHHLVITYSIWI